MKRWIIPALVAVTASMSVAVANLDPLLAWAYQDSVDADAGDIQVSGLQSSVHIRRDELGVPLIEAQSMQDLAFGVGYAMASDRLEQMISFTLAAQGRLSEMAGPVTLDMDIYMRILGLGEAARRQFSVLDPRTRELLEHFSAGINAYIDTHKDRLPFGMALAGYHPEPWQPINSLYIFAILNLGLSMNLQEELAFLQFAQRVGPEKAAWLLPIYPDEPLPFAEAAKMNGLDLKQAGTDLSRLQRVQAQVASLFPQNSAASNNWAVHKDRTRGGASILANDTHLLLSHPPLWTLMQVRSPEYNAGGIALAGIPGVVAGYNGHVAWGMTMVMADSQDLFLEELREIDGKLHYRHGDAWVPVIEREEVFRVKGGSEVVRMVRSTRHGPLLNDALVRKPHNALQPDPIQSSYGLALSQTSQAADKTMEAILRLGQAKNMAEAGEAIDAVEYIHLNMVYADRDNIGWRVTGRYPSRRKGTGQLPSPGWTEEYDWNGYVAPELRPAEENPAEGFIATANHRTVAKPPFTISSNWYYPERHQRIAQVLAEADKQDAESTSRLQFDRRNLLVGKLQTLWRQPEMASALDSAINELSLPDRGAAREALKAVLDFDAEMAPESAGAAYFGVFEHLLMRELFLDELGPEDSSAWHALVMNGGFNYAALQDHELGRPDSPFWDDVTTPASETKADILVRALAKTPGYLEQRLGPDRAAWQWGRIHQYTWRSSASEMAPFMSWQEQAAVGLLNDFLDRGPFPAGGDRNTVNVAGHSTGSDFNVWNIPAMRLVVDFSREEPLWVVNGGGQSGNPVSPHYDDGIAIWLTPRNRQMAWHAPAANAQYDRVLRLRPQP